MDKYIVHISLAILLCIYTVNGLSCYQCASTSTGGLCADTFDPHSGVISSTDGFEVGSVNVITTDCDYCFKQRTHVKGKTFVTRGCTQGEQPWDEDGCETMYQDKWWRRYSADICYCRTDYCNSANSYRAPVAMVMTLVLMVTLICNKFC